jgi:hypothetical protein
MVGGTTFRRRVISREISRVLVLNLSGKKGGAHRTAQEIFVLDTAFVLIEGHPRFRNGKGKHEKPGHPSPPTCQLVELEVCDPNSEGCVPISIWVFVCGGGGGGGKPGQTP